MLQFYWVLQLRTFLYSDFDSIECYSKSAHSEASQTPIISCTDRGIESNESILKDTKGRKDDMPRGLKSVDSH